MRITGATGRSGSIAFTLTAGGDSAFGDVIMVPRGWGRPLRAWDRTERGAATKAQPSSQVLTINFDGRLAGDTIEGTYTTTVAGSATSQRAKTLAEPKETSTAPAGDTE